MLELQQRLALEQKLSPQQILLSTLLQLNSMSLEQRIKQEMELNPLLEETDSLDELEEVENEEDIESILEDNPELNLDNNFDDSISIREDEKLSEKLEKTEEMDWEKIERDDDNYESKLPRDPNEEEFERQDASELSAHELLIEQSLMLNLNEAEQKIAEYIIYNLRDDGYLDEVMTLETIALIFDAKTKRVEEILKLIQRLEPKGMASRNLRECLLVQLEDRFDPIGLLAFDIIRFAFDEFTNKKFEKIASIVEAEMSEIKEAILLINKLNPKPGVGFLNQKTNYIIPDFIVERYEDSFVVIPNEWGMPHLQISNKYIEMINDKKSNKETKVFIKRKIESAKWFITAIEQRKMTLMKVMNAIVQLQLDFFDKGPNFIRPMIMKEIAEIIKMDISTVSRVSNGKYVQTEYGVFELKFFFSERMETTDGEEVSTKIIKEKIAELCRNEEKDKPLADDLIAEKLIESGFQVARRTVAKYREQLGIPVARLRREMV